MNILTIYAIGLLELSHVSILSLIKLNLEFLPLNVEKKISEKYIKYENMEMKQHS